jgi:hypothetical protein
LEAVEPRSRRDRGVTALIEGFFGMAWFGWGQANASPGLSAVLTAGSVLSALVAIAGGMLAFRGPSRSRMHDPAVGRRYGTIVGIEFGTAALGAVILTVTGAGAYVPVWVCGVVGVHFFALAPVLEDRMLIPLGALTTAVAVAALVTGLATPTAPSSVTGAGAGTLLLVFAALALLGAGSARLRPRDRGAQPR